MSLYSVLFLIGAVGIVVLTLLGLGHSDSGDASAVDHGGSGADVGLSHGDAGVGHADATIGHADAAHGAHDSGLHFGKVGGVLLSVMSPLGFFAMCLGGGVGGLLGGRFVAPSLLPYVAIASAIFMNFGVVRPMFRTLLGFASTPAKALEGSLASQAEAVSRFDDQGRGVVRLTVDGESIRLLAHLEQTELQDAMMIRPGDALIITEVDAARNVCKVSRL